MSAFRIEHEHVAAQPARAVNGVLASAVTIMTTDGRPVTSGHARIDATATAGWTATVHGLDRPGVIASMFFGEGTRDVVLRLDDGRVARARIAGTTFTPGRQRVCELIGVEPLT
jgi:hypothetical protein